MTPKVSGPRAWTLGGRSKRQAITQTHHWTEELYHALSRQTPRFVLLGTFASQGYPSRSETISSLELADENDAPENWLQSRSQRTNAQKKAEYDESQARWGTFRNRPRAAYVSRLPTCQIVKQPQCTSHTDERWLCGVLLMRLDRRKPTLSGTRRAGSQRPRSRSCRRRRGFAYRPRRPMSPRQPDELSERFARTLRRVRLERHLSQEELADLCDMHRTEVSLIERGRREPGLETLLKFSAAVEVSVADLLDGIRWEPSAGRSSAGRFWIAPDSVSVPPYARSVVSTSRPGGCK